MKICKILSIANKINTYVKLNATFSLLALFLLLQELSCLQCVKNNGFSFSFKVPYELLSTIVQQTVGL